jgi:hypothetical protein
MLVLVDIPEKHAEDEDDLVKDDKQLYSTFSTTYVRYSHRVLGQWSAKMEGKPSVLRQPPPRAVQRSGDESE